MEFKKPKSKKNPPAPRKNAFPLPEDRQVGVYNGLNVTVFDWTAMNDLYFSGNFGKGSLSKSAPTYHIKKDDYPKILYQQQFDHQSKWHFEDIQCETCTQKCMGCTKQSLDISYRSLNNFLQAVCNDGNGSSWNSRRENCNMDVEDNTKNVDNNVKKMAQLLEFSTDESCEVDKYLSTKVNEILQSKQAKQLKLVSSTTEDLLVVSSDSCSMDFSLENINVKLAKRPLLIEENLKLNLEESFFLKYVLNSLKIVDLNYKELSVPELWREFSASQRNFLERYSTYHYYRAKGWVVRSGLKFGGDFLLYKDGPAYCHGSYLIKVLDGRKKLTWRDFIGINRLVETFNKDIVFSDVIPTVPDKETEFPDGLRNYAIQEVMVRRWFPSKERVAKD